MPRKSWSYGKVHTDDENLVENSNAVKIIIDGNVIDHIDDFDHIVYNSFFADNHLIDDDNLVFHYNLIDSNHTHTVDGHATAVFDDKLDEDFVNETVDGAYKGEDILVVDDESEEAAHVNSNAGFDNCIVNITIDDIVDEGPAITGYFCTQSIPLLAWCPRSHQDSYWM
ncbi:hypothetical protein NDU88_006572 [Pleurodeles waltl]|uniref:Uncharacterized protein n=1 Tax=Pleurodeles waltl TaxID=8319 RepID=A0AAV7X1Y4_PLEWA|nr:hypothetical protein NDU88_006572 [Pleurodeles waltl]